MTQPTDPHIGRVLKSTYRIERLIGRGGMGAVYEARHTKISKRFAIKLLLPEMGSTPTTRERFLREAEACSRIDHENVVEIFDFDETPEGELFMVMEMLKGEDLSDRLRESAPLPVDDVIRWFTEICNAVAEAHRHGIVHRDLKPGNVFIQRRGERELIKVLDFGLAKFRAEAGLTASGAMMGTPCYMAPEQIEGQGEAMGPVTDVFALGCILYELLVGKVAFHGKSLAQIAFKIVHGERPLLSEGPYQALQPVITQCLATDPNERFQSVDELRSAFIVAMGEVEVAPQGLLTTMAAAQSAERETMARGPAHSATLPAAGSLGDSGMDATIAAGMPVSPSTVGRPDSSVGPAEPSVTGTEPESPDDLPDAAMYTTTGRLKQRKWTLLTVLLVVAGAVAALLLVQHLRHDRGGQRQGKKSSTALPAWARGLPEALHADLARVEQPARWHTLSQATWTTLATALEKANQPDLGHDKLQRLQVRMYLARSRASLLAAKLVRAQKLAGLALRKSSDSGDGQARFLAASNAAWIHLHQGRPAAARAALKGIGGPNDPRLLVLRAAVNLAQGDVGTVVSSLTEATREAAAEDPTGWLVLSIAAARSGRRLDAERAAARALALAPDHPPARIQMAQMLAGTPTEGTTALELCLPRKGDPMLYRYPLAVCKVRLVVADALDRTDAHTSRAVLVRVGGRLSDGELLASAPLLLGRPGLPQEIVKRIARLIRARGAAHASHDKLIGAAAALLLGKLNEAAGLAKEYSTGLYRAQTLLAEIALRAGRPQVALKTYAIALTSAGQVGVRARERPRPKDPVPGACDLRAPRETDYQVIRLRIAQIRRQSKRAAVELGRGLRPVLAMVLRGDPVL